MMVFNGPGTRVFRSGNPDESVWFSTEYVTLEQFGSIPLLDFQNSKVRSDLFGPDRTGLDRTKQTEQVRHIFLRGGGYPFNTPLAIGVAYISFFDPRCLLPSAFVCDV